ncbi:hypothetical protein [Marinoscillum sp. MHG1-6]|uniref:hypothetical protein n=1 Tax=Marinoscillum sp. MHG1-6 TaxID=2959627 RepID=UPI0021588C6E|nr:hypothetical protein [Marinoscillum sp. MHG1-6]
MNIVNGRNVKFVEFDTSTNWASALPTSNWLVIILTKSKNKQFFGEIIKKSIDRNVSYICSIGEQQDIVHDMADEEIVYRDVDIEHYHLPEHRIITTGHQDFEEGIWFGLFSANNDECEINDVVIINVTNDKSYGQLTLDLISKIDSGYIPKDD